MVLEDGSSIQGVLEAGSSKKKKDGTGPELFSGGHGKNEDWLQQACPQEEEVGVFVWL